MIRVPRIQMGKESLQQIRLEKLDIHTQKKKKMKLDPYRLPYTKNQI